VFFPRGLIEQQEHRDKLLKQFIKQISNKRTAGKEKAKNIIRARYLLLKF
jgi:hypothetical protein